MKKLHALILTYNCAEVIEACLESLVGKVHDVVILDNKWIGVEDNNKFATSDDGTTEKIIAFRDKHPQLSIKLLLATTKRLYQHQARNLLLDQIPEGDWFLIIDSDEVIIRWMDGFKDELDELTKIKGFRPSEKVKGIYWRTVRLMCKTKGLHWTRNHRYMRDDEGDVQVGDFLILDSIALTHQPASETKAMRSVMTKYKDWRHEWESENADG